MGKFKDISREMNALKEQTKEYSRNQDKPSKIESVSSFFSSIGSSLHFIFMEKENMMFALMQWLSVLAGYYLWVEVLAWIPKEIWDTAEEQHDWANLILFLWSFFCVGLVSYLIGILNACMCASFLLRFQGQKSTVSECLKLALQHSGTLWIFSWIDGWWTVDRIVERLPSKDRPPLFVRLAQEFAYQCWKISSMGFVPALLYGRGLCAAASDSFKMLTSNFGRLIKLRIGYSVSCWVVAIISYFGSFYWIFKMRTHIDQSMMEYSVFWYLGVPILLALIIVMIFLRPLYIISICRVYAQYARTHTVNANFPKKHSVWGLFIFILYLVFLGTMLYVFAFHKELGIDDLMFDNIISNG